MTANQRCRRDKFMISSFDAAHMKHTESDEKRPFLSITDAVERHPELQLTSRRQSEFLIPWKLRLTFVLRF